MGTPAGTIIQELNMAVLMIAEKNARVAELEAEVEKLREDGEAGWTQAREWKARAMMSDESKLHVADDELVDRVAYPIFVGCAKTRWADDEPCPVQPLSKNQARNIARACIDAMRQAEADRLDDE